MSAIHYVQTFIFPAAYALLPGVMHSPEADAHLLAIGHQESEFIARVQLPHGPAHGFWQFEGGKTAAVAGVLEHPATRAYAIQVCHELQYDAERAAVYEAITHNDILACCFARLLLWTLPGRLATRDQEPKGWSQYLTAWRPGAPRPDDWHDCWSSAWQLVV
jgi:hypothetical protein